MKLNINKKEVASSTITKNIELILYLKFKNFRFPKTKKNSQKSLTVYATSIGFTTKRNNQKSYRINRIAVCLCSHKPLFEISFIDTRFNEPILFAIQDYFLEKYLF